MNQGADNNLPRDFYQFACDYINNGDSVLNLGSGTKFNFEKTLHTEKKVHITAVDILNIRNIPVYVNEFINCSVEDKITFQNQYDVVTFFELIEHIDKTDILIRNCYENLKKNGLLIFSFPNLSSIYGRMELLFGYQPHILEVSNNYSNYGTGLFGRLNNPEGAPLHHIRGITYKAMCELISANGFKIIKKIGYSYRLANLFYKFPSLSPVVLFVCKKQAKPNPISV